jgi:hypothetical protein
VYVEAIEILPPFFAPNGGPFVGGKPVRLEYRDGCFYFPQHFRLKARPSVGNVAVLPGPTKEILEMVREYSVGGRQWKNESGWRRIVNDPRDKHCHQDCPWITAGSIVHLRTRVDKAGLCLTDVHGYIAEGEPAFGASEVKRTRFWIEGKNLSDIVTFSRSSRMLTDLHRLRSPSAAEPGSSTTQPINRGSGAQNAH